MSVAGHLGKMLLFRYAETKTAPASSVTVLEISAAISAPVLSLNVVDELIVSDKESDVLEYSGDSGITWNTCMIPMEAGSFSGKTLLFRAPANDVNFGSSVAALSIPVRADAPAASVDTVNETVVTNPETGIEYSANSGETWTALRGRLDVSGLTGETILVRTAYTDTLFHSENTIITIPARREAPVVLVGPDKFEIPDGVEFSSDEGKTWGQVPSAITDDLLGKTVLFRFPADSTNFASKSVYVALPDRADGPILALDRASLTVNTDSSMEYSADNGVTWSRAEDNMSVANLLGRTLQFRYAATAVMPASSVTTLEVPAVISTPVLSLDMSNELIVSNKGNETLEFSEDSGITWKSCTMPMQIGSFSGKTLQFRTPSDDKDPENIVTILVPARIDAPAVSIDMVAETVSTDSSMEISVDGGKTWAAAEKNMNASGLAGGAILLRYACTDTMFRSENVIVSIPVRRPAPAVSINGDKFEVPNGVEFSSNAREIWGQVPSAITDNLFGRTLLFRLPANDKNFASQITYVTLPSSLDGPVLTLDRVNLTVNTDTNMEYSADSGKTWTRVVKSMSVSNLLGRTLLFRYAAAKDTLASSNTTLVIPNRGPAPVVAVYNVSSYGRNDGIILGSKGMEYQKAGTSVWMKASGSSIGALAAGTYEVRYAATETSIASETRFVTVYVDGNTGSNSNSGTSERPSKPSNPGSSNNPGQTGSGNFTGSANSSYTVKFNTNGGSKVNSQTVKKNGLVKEPVSPAREDYIFLGWYTDSKLTKPYDFDTKVKERMTLYAKWEKVSMDDNSGNPGFIEPTPVDPTPIEPTPIEPTPVEPTPLPVNPPAQTYSSLLNGDSGISYVNGRSEGVFAPKLSITRGETAMILYRLMSDEARAAYYETSNNFNDVGHSAWYNEAISTLVQASVLDGCGDGTFRPEQPVTRAELAAILVRVQGGSSTSGGAGFTDTSGHWAEGYISSAVRSGLVLGYEDGSFKPNQSVTRAESVTMINRMLMRSVMDTSASATVTFTDVQPSDWFYGDVMAAANGYLN